MYKDESGFTIKIIAVRGAKLLHAYCDLNDLDRLFEDSDFDVNNFQEKSDEDNTVEC